MLGSSVDAIGNVGGDDDEESESEMVRSYEGLGLIDNRAAVMPTKGLKKSNTAEAVADKSKAINA